MKSTTRLLSLAILANSTCMTSAFAMHTGSSETPSAPQTAADMPAAAQSASEQSESGSTTGIADIVVTAQRREESLQKVPIAVAAITGEALLSGGVTGSMELPAKIPGLTIPIQRNVLTPYLRGVGTQNGGSGSEAAVATYIDGVYVAAPSGNTLSFSNITRVEVLKGPQGTLFGRNATGGLLQVITKDPSYEPAVDASVGYANYETISGSFYGSTGLGDKVAFNLAGFVTNQGKGWGRNITLNEEVNYTNEFGVRGKLLFEPDELTKLILAADYGERRSDLGASRHLFPGTRNAVGVLSAGGFYDTQGGVPRNFYFQQYGASLTISREIGDAEIKSITAFRSYNNFGVSDLDQGPSPLATVTGAEIAKTYQQELLISGKTGRLTYTAGVFLFRNDSEIAPFTIASGLVPSQNTQQFSYGKTKSIAGYGQLTYELTDTTRITGGVRYTVERSHGYATSFAAPGNTIATGTVLGNIDQRSTDKKLTFRAAIDQDLAPNILAYASFNRGFKSGAINVFSPFQPITRPEGLDAYEIGLKSDLLDRHVRLNLSGFIYDYSNIQLSQLFGITNVLVNAAGSKIKGFEAELSVAPDVGTGKLRFDAAVSYLHGRYTSFPNAPFFAPRPTGGNATFAGNAAGKDTIYTPPWTVNLAADYSVPIGSNVLGANVSYYYNDGFYYNPDNRLRQAAYGIVNAELRYGDADRSWEAAVFARNLFDKQYPSYIAVSALFDATAPAAPRTYGVRLTYRFGKSR